MVRRIISFLCVLGLMIALYACEAKQSVVGVWRTYDIGVEIDSPELPEYLTFVFAADGTGSGPVSDLQRLDYPTFTYEVYDDVIKVHTDDDRDIEMKYFIDGDSMTLTFDGYTRTLHKISD